MPIPFSTYAAYAAANADEMPLYLFDKHFTQTVSLAAAAAAAAAVAAGGAACGCTRRRLQWPPLGVRGHRGAGRGSTSCAQLRV